ncbi:hypothetical protein K493DRAFT_345623 [Basidiobolus meristosporus CBS 931.73]|uniref:Fe2OG dioxygenase domain-containing protein n=1 Tax=Basidiobolus meristosporus CBS 931.73 TaxID=1314790 RepID=A0A1Y1Z2J2_9FUNG|nr:hypothetical protein K493DRAFT_345623 [Basidiobolus meristosporus CBS 931.73]|eukprot:ORY04406.1 hypothetical protein K493DRAFT_345623 [Basidiobolus meristosporus CBS 931.73]
MSKPSRKLSQPNITAWLNKKPRGSPSAATTNTPEPDPVVIKPPEIRELQGGTGTLTYYPRYFTKEQADRYLEYLEENLEWKRYPIKMFGKVVQQPRTIAYIGDKQYTYSGLTLGPTAWDPVVKEIANSLEDTLELPRDYFNFVLCNRYTSGAEYMGYHSDNESSLGERPIIASTSFGQARPFFFQHKLDKSLKIEYHLEHGSTLVMSGLTQKYWKHALPKRPSALYQTRINLTFRKVFH